MGTHHVADSTISVFGLDCICRKKTNGDVHLHIIPIGVLALGYSAEAPLAPEVRQRFRARRRPRAEVIHREQW
jgi:hypothetical protein